MKTILAATITAVTVAGLSFGAMAATVTTTTKTPMKPAMSMSMHHKHKVCKTVWHHHKKTTVCVWVK